MTLFLYPLQTFVLTVTIFREAVDDIRRHQRDKEVNSQKYRRLVRGRDTPELVPSSKLRVGDLVSVFELGIYIAAFVTRAFLPRKSESIGKMWEFQFNLQFILPYFIKYFEML